jgi:5S rRNA maturation endonuclease (ribonuclease M5)
MDVVTQILLPKLEGIRPSGGSWMVRCPAHEDSTASLHISRGTEQPVVLKCHAGCDPVDVLAAMDLTWDTLCVPAEERPARGEWTPQGDAVAIYDYTDETGNLLYQALRTADKKFSQRVPDRSQKSGYRWKLGDTRRVLYRLPKVVAAITAGEIIYIAEGEKDVHALECVGVTATCNSGGAGKWQADFAEVFRDAVVIIIADKDKPGQEHARRVAASMDGIAAAVEIAEAAGAGKDAADHLAAGHAVADFEVTWSSGTEPAIELAPDLHEFLGAVDPPYEWVIEGILEHGDRLIWTGEEGLGKTTTGRMLAVAAACGVHPFNNDRFAPQRVLWIDCENSARQGRRHFRKLERIAVAKGRRVPDGGMRLIHRPEGIDLTRDEDIAFFLERVHAHRPDLLYIGPLYRLHNTDINDESAARQVTAVLDQARVKSDCALIVEGHSPHGNGETRPIRPIGSSLFRRWPEFGYGISPANSEDPCSEVRVRAWRGARDERHWPKFLMWGTRPDDWPWIDPDQQPKVGYGHPYAVPDAS